MADRLSATLPRRVSQVTTTAWKNSDSRLTANSMLREQRGAIGDARGRPPATYLPCSLYMNAPMIWPATMMPAMPE